MLKHRVVILLDKSEFSRQILPQVRRFISPEENELYLLYVMPPPRGLINRPTQPADAEWLLPMYASHYDAKLAKHPIYASQVEDSLTTQIEEEFLLDVRWLEAAGYTVTITVKFGNPTHKILDFVKEEDIDLIAMTTHGRAGLGRFIFGSVAEEILHNVSVPILLLRPWESS